MGQQEEDGDNHLEDRRRYVDDTICLSATMCVSCIEKALHGAYGLSFKYQPPAVAGEMEWLDLILNVKTGVVTAKERKPGKFTNAEWVLAVPG